MSARELRVLVVDDEAPIRLLCRVNLEAEQMDVLEAADGLSGLEAARRERPDVILLDVMMPGLDGWRVAEELLEDPATSAIPIVFLTARAELRDQARGLDLGGLDYVTKPFNPVELAQTIRDVISRVEGGERDELRRAKLAELRALIEERARPRPEPYRRSDPKETRRRGRGPSERARSPSARPRRRSGSAPLRLSPSQAQATMLATTGSTIAVIPARVALMCRIEPTIRKNGTIVPSTTIQVISTQTGRWQVARGGRAATPTVPGTSNGKAPPRLDDRPEDRREQEAAAEERDRVALADRALGEEQVAGEGDRREQREDDAEPVERDAVPEVDDERQSDERERQRDPDPPANMLLQHEEGEERDEQRAEVLDQQRDADLEPVDREEVEELDERDAEDAEHREVERARAGSCGGSPAA